jgi:hypothetical protein
MLSARSAETGWTTVGKLIYGPGGHEYEIEDRALAHLQLVMLAKLRRGESFPFTWWRDRDAGRVTMWICPPQQLQFVYDGGKMPEINRAWVEELMVAANSGAGLRIVAEPPMGPGSGHPL